MDMPSNLAIVKFVTNGIVGAGVSKIALDIISNNVNDPENVRQKALVFAGASVLGLMAKDASKKYVNAEIDSLVELFKKHKEKEIVTQFEAATE